MGDATYNVATDRVSKRGFFPGSSGKINFGSGYPGLKSNMTSSIVDGTSNTIATSEVVCGKEENSNAVKGGVVFYSGSPNGRLGTIDTTNRKIFQKNYQVNEPARGERHTDGIMHLTGFITVLLLVVSC